MRFMPGTPAYKAYHAMLDTVRAANTHLSEADLDAKLCAARDDYCRNLRDAPTLRSTSKAALAGPKTLHPNALRKLGVPLPAPEPALAPVSEPDPRPDWVTPDWDHDDYSPCEPFSQ